MFLYIKKLHPNAKMPVYAHGPMEDAGMDLCCVEDIKLRPWQTVLIGTGIAIEIPSGIEMQIRPRGGLSQKGLRILNSPGTVDPGFRGEVTVIARWEPDLVRNEDGYYSVPDTEMVINAGDRIAQAVFSRYLQVDPHWSGSLSTSERGWGMLGSTGK